MASAVASIWQGITYRGREGHYAWLLHRVGGLGIMAFLLLHILDIFLVGFGPEIFGKFLILYTLSLIHISWEVIHDRIEQHLNTLVLQCGSQQDRNQLVRNNRLAK